MNKTNVLIVDDHALVREGIIAFLKYHDDIQVIGEASNGLEAIEKAEKLKPDVIIMDISMPELGGIEATVEIKKRHPDIKILILSQYDDQEYVSRLLKAGVSGYLLKHAVGTDLITAIRAVAKGESYLYSTIATKVIDGYLGKSGEMALDVPYEKLTDREKQVLKLIAEGHSHKEIASLLDISAKTVIAHQTNISEKLDLHSRAALIKFAITKGIIKLGT
ncbi:MAG: two component transcriptional regulator, LuxR family [Nitrospirae bacterium]|jgi:DNA-binding NarL/FixJ family response regulator|nr:two component transcriptional regulator, LuxR family [Nitrospirota bacterium]MBS1126376.1 two component transcriptional regulator, LuxR family [Nitrospirota bacterium]